MTDFKAELSKIEGVYRFKIEVPFDVKFVCVYLFRLGETNVLFDAGLDAKSWSRAFFALLEEAGMTGKQNKKKLFF